MTSTADERRLKEAAECLAKAEEHLKTSFLKLKTKPNYDSAAYEYDRAAVCYRNAGRLDLCRDSYLKSAECYAGTKNLFHEAKSKEAAAMAAKDAKDLQRAVELFEQSAEGYLLSGSADTASMTIDKAAKIVEALDPEKAVRLYEHGLTIVCQADRGKMALNFLNRLVAIHIRAGKWADALAKLREQVAKCEELGETGKIGFLVMGMALVELKRDDSVAALKALHYLPEWVPALDGVGIGGISAEIQFQSAHGRLPAGDERCQERN